MYGNGANIHAMAVAVYIRLIRPLKNSCSMSEYMDSAWSFADAGVDPCVLPFCMPCPGGELICLAVAVVCLLWFLGRAPLARASRCISGVVCGAARGEVPPPSSCAFITVRRPNGVLMDSVYGLPPAWLSR